VIQDRDVKVIIPMRALQIEDSRQWAAALQEFPTYAWHSADQFEKLLLKETAGPEDGAQLAKLVAFLKVDCGAADQTVKTQTQIVQGAIISDPEGRKGPCKDRHDRYRHPF